MASILTFGGLVPRKAWHTLPENCATMAHDVKLRNGRLEAWRTPQVISDLGSGVQTFYLRGCCPVGWEQCVDVADFPPDFDRCFITGRSEQPEILQTPGCVPTYTFLGVPAPLTAPQVSATEGYDREASMRSYVYTYLNQFGEESAPSPASTPLSIIDGAPVVLSALAPPPGGYGIVGILIYRTATAARNGDEKEQTPGTVWLLVDGGPADAVGYTDTVLERNLGAALTTQENRVPPAALRSIRHIGATATLVGAVQNRVHFSQNYEPHNWPATLDLTLEERVVHLEAGDNVVYVSTQGCPVVIDGHPLCEERQCRAVTVARAPLPDVGCIFPQGSALTPYGMVYSSPEGLIMLRPDAVTDILTAPWFGPDEWRKLRPETVRLAFWRNMVVCVTEMISFFLGINAQPYGDYELGALTTFSEAPTDMRVTANGELLMLLGGKICQWDAGDQWKEYRWESRELSFDGQSAPNSAKVRGYDTTFTLLTPWADVSYSRRVSDEKPFRIGRLGRHLNYRIKLEGTGTVEFVDLGTSFLTVDKGA